MMPQGRPRSLASLERFRSYVTVLARGSIPRDLQARIGESDIVGQVLLRAVEDFGKFRGASAGEWMAYLRKQLAHTLIDTMRAMRRRARDPRREQALRDQIESMDGRIDQVLVADATPVPDAIARREQQARVLEVLASLPPEQYYVIEQRRLYGRPTREVAAELHKTEGAVRKLEARALQTLRQRLRGEASR